jgi:cysteine desulfuration protein SufE
MGKKSVSKEEFASCHTVEEVYHQIIALGKKLPFFDPSWKTEENRVVGCQSLMYLHVEQKEGKLFFSAFSEALISAGLAALLVFFYNEKTPEEILKTPPTFLVELKIPESLTPSRANGLSSLYTHIKKEALKCLLKTSA